MKIIIRIFLYFQHIWKLFIGFLSKKKIHSNNPQLSRLMESNLSFKELEIKRKKLINKKLKLCAELNAFKYNKMERGIDYNILDFNEKNDKISQINSLLKGIEVKLRKIGYVYEYIKEIVAKNEFNEKILLKNRCEIILEKKYELPLNQEDFIEIFKLLDLNDDENLISIRHIDVSNLSKIHFVSKSQLVVGIQAAL